MSEPSATGNLTYHLDDLGAAICKVIVDGSLTLDSGKELLESVWEDHAYTQFGSAIWDISACELPDFNVLLRMAQFAAREKRGRGPQIVAFVSPEFASSALLRAFRGFENILKLKINFFADNDAAIDWVTVRASTDG